MGTACAEFSKAIYIDIDCVIARDIQPMLDFELVGAPIAAFHEIQVELDFVHHALAEYKDYAYFNSGVLVVDLDYWRKNGIEELLLDESLSLSPTLGFADQDILNRVFRNNWTPLSMNFNYMINTYPNIKLTDPIVVHFAGLGKPWISSTVGSKWRDLWTHYARM
jgi:lipopolysaccharide biosynthesis glycosyltransferase